MASFSTGATAPRFERRRHDSCSSPGRRGQRGAATARQIASQAGALASGRAISWGAQADQALQAQGQHGKFAGSPAENALTRLKTLGYGGAPLDETEASGQLLTAGLTSIRTLPAPQGSVLSFVR